MKKDFGNRKNTVGTWDRTEFNRLRPNWKQIRTANCIEVTHSGQECGQVDALWTRASGVPIAVTTADCVPILLSRIDEKAIAVIHAGWQGTFQKIVQKFFEQLPEDLRNGNAWSAYLGPSNRVCCYEFGEDLLQNFFEIFSDLPRDIISPKFRHLDLIAINSHELKKQGVAMQEIYPDCTFCTFEANGERRYLSFRSGDRDSRQYSIIMK